MGKNIKENIRLAIIIVISMIIGSVFTMFIKENNNSVNYSYSSKDRKEFNSLYETYDTIMKDYYKSVDSNTLIEGAINGMLGSLNDEHTMYFDKKSKEAFDSELSGNYYGIGAQIQLTGEGTIKITKVFNDSPAEKAGLKAEDVFVSVDGVSVKGKNATEVANMLKSNTVKTSKIVIKREGNEINFDVTKENITLFSVSSEILKNNNKNIGYLSVSIFGQKTYSQFKDALLKLESQNMDSLIIDLRGNTGGYLYTVTNMLEEFVGKDNIMYQIQSSNGVKKYKSSKETSRKYKIVILVDENSASASEIMAASMKGTVQTTKNLSNGSMIKYTIEKWLTPNGKNIDKEGITPDYDVNIGDSYLNSPTKENDMQLKKALDLLK